MLVRIGPVTNMSWHSTLEELKSRGEVPFEMHWTQEMYGKRFYDFLIVRMNRKDVLQEVKKGGHNGVVKAILKRLIAILASEEACEEAILNISLCDTQLIELGDV